MTAPIERRVERLESQSAETNSSIAVVFVQDGETKADALLRAGFDPTTKHVIVVSFK